MRWRLVLAGITAAAATAARRLRPSRPRADAEDSAGAPPGPWAGFPLEELLLGELELFALCAALDAASVARLRCVCRVARERLADGEAVARWVADTRDWAALKEQHKTGDMPLAAPGGSWSLERLHLLECPPRYAPVLFRFGSARLVTNTVTGGLVPALEGVVELMKRHPTLRLRVTGHAQPDAPTHIAIQLSASRAATVVRYIAARTAELPVATNIGRLRVLVLTPNIGDDSDDDDILEDGVQHINHDGSSDDDDDEEDEEDEDDDDDESGMDDDEDEEEEPAPNAPPPNVPPAQPAPQPAPPPTPPAPLNVMGIIEQVGHEPSDDPEDVSLGLSDDDDGNGLGRPTHAREELDTIQQKRKVYMEVLGRLDLVAAGGNQPHNNNWQQSLAEGGAYEDLEVDRRVEFTTLCV